MFILRRLNWSEGTRPSTPNSEGDKVAGRVRKSKDVKKASTEVDTEQYDLHQDIWIRCMKQIRDERTGRFERERNEKLKKELSLNSSNSSGDRRSPSELVLQRLSAPLPKSITRNVQHSGYKKIAEGGILSHQDSMTIRKPESIHR